MLNNKHHLRSTEKSSGFCFVLAILNLPHHFKTRDFRVKIFVQKNVTRFNVEVNNLQARFFMKVL